MSDTNCEELALRVLRTRDTGHILSRSNWHQALISGSFLTEIFVLSQNDEHEIAQ